MIWQFNTVKPVWEFFFDEGRRHFAGGEFLVVINCRQERNVVADPLDLKTVQSHAHFLNGEVTGRRPCAQFCNHRIIKHADLTTVIDARVVAHGVFPLRGIPLPFTISDKRSGGDFHWRAVSRQTANRGQEPTIRIFGIKAAFHGPPRQGDIALRHRKFFAIRHADHLFDQINACDELRDRVFHLKARVHFKEVEIAVPIDDEFNRTGRGVIDGLGQRDGLLAHGLAGGLIQKRAWRFFDDLLLAALNGTLTLAQINAVAVAVTENLNFNVARLGDELFDEDTIIAERIGGLVLRGLEPFARAVVVPSDTHPLTTATSGGFDHDGISDFAADRDRLFRILNQPHMARNRGHLCLLGDLLGRDLVAHFLNRALWGADKRNARRLKRLGEFGVLRQKTIARMHGLCARFLDCLHDLVDHDVGLIGRRRPDVNSLIRHANVQCIPIRVRIHRDCFDPHFTGRFDNTAGDFTTVGDQDFFEHGDSPLECKTAAQEKSCTAVKLNECPSEGRVCLSGRYE